MPADDNNRSSFTLEEWSACLKVLEALIDRPEAAPDRERVERLVARLGRNARRGRRKSDAEARRRDDRVLIARTGRVRSSPGPGPLPEGPPESGALLAKARRCYVCKGPYREIHHHYHLLCPACARFNFAKRHQRADLTGRRAVVTGGRVKIGYQVALKLLRDGADVTVTTRYSREAALRFADEADFGTWRDRLRVESVDFRAPSAVLAFADGLGARWPFLDILINNAAQTVRRPPEPAALALEHLPAAGLPANVRGVLGVGPPGAEAPGSPALRPERSEAPPERSEANGWTARLPEVEPAELLEVLMINAAAPFLLIGRLKPLLLRSPFPDRYIVNVAGLDGQFGREFKTDRHPHVNMSKAALNMITRTSAADYARDGISINSVDAGWVSHEGGYSARLRMRAQGFVPPLDEVDAAARIYDPIVRGLAGAFDCGQFFKDYRTTAW